MSKLLPVLISAALFASISLSFSAAAVGETSVDGQAKKAATKKVPKAAVTPEKKANPKNKNEKTKIINADENYKGGGNVIHVR